MSNVTHNFSCVTFDIGPYTFGFDVKDILYIVPAAALIKHPGQADYILGYVNLSGTFGPVFDIDSFLMPGSSMTEILPEHYYLFFTPIQAQLAAIRLKTMPEFHKGDIIGIENWQNAELFQIARFEQNSAMLLSPTIFLDTHMEILLPSLIKSFAVAIQGETDESWKTLERQNDL